MKDMGEADVILGIKIIRDGNGIKLSQDHYIEKVLKRFNIFKTSLISTPMDKLVKLCRHDKEPVLQLVYSKVIGSLMYVMTCRRLDIAFVVAKLCRLQVIQDRIIGKRLEEY